MGKSTEGAVLKDGQIESLSSALLQLDISSAANGREIEARTHFVQNLKRVIGDIANPQMPFGIKPTLLRLIQESDYYIKQGNESAFVRLCNDAIEVTRQGWSILSSWMSTPQNICYNIHWGVKDAMEKHNKEMLKVTAMQNHSSKNDPVSTSINPNATRNKTELDNHSTTKYSFPLFNVTLVKLMLAQYGQHQAKKEANNVVRMNPDPFSSCQELYKNKI
ncbi:MAG: hypothetical protein AB7I18_12805 [Candidatus Berkiella sp.]